MNRYKALNIPEFEEQDEISRNVYLRKAYSKYPFHSHIPSMTMYHKKEILTNGDFQNILDWYDNLQELKKGSIPQIKKEKRKEVKSKSIKSEYYNILSFQEIEDRDLLIEKEREFRFKIVKKYRRY